MEEMVAPAGEAGVSTSCRSEVEAWECAEAYEQEWEQYEGSEAGGLATRVFCMVAVCVRVLLFCVRARIDC